MWSGGILKTVSKSVVAFDIREAAHHLDLFFSHPSDNASLRAARKLEMKHVKQWVKEARQKKKRMYRVKDTRLRLFNTARKWRDMW